MQEGQQALEQEEGGGSEEAAAAKVRRPPGSGAAASAGRAAALSMRCLHEINSETGCGHSDRGECGLTLG